MYRKLSSQRILARVRNCGFGLAWPWISTKSSVQRAAFQAGSSSFPSITKGAEARGHRYARGVIGCILFTQSAWSEATRRAGSHAIDQKIQTIRNCGRV